MAQLPSFTTIIENSAKLPFVRVDRAKFLAANLVKHCTPAQLQTAITEGTLQAGIPIQTLDNLANAVINFETIKVTSISAAAGIPGGYAMIATIPADLAQFYGFVIRVAQELAYIYGWKNELASTSDLDTETQSQLVIFIGVMSGVAAANKVVTKLFGETAMKAVAKKVASQALTKTWYYPIAKKIAALLGQRMVKSTFAGGVSKVVPIIGGVVSGGMTLATFKPMCHRLKDQLSSLAHMTPEEFNRYEASLVIDAEVELPVGETVMNAIPVSGYVVNAISVSSSVDSSLPISASEINVLPLSGNIMTTLPVSEVSVPPPSAPANYWSCACGAQNKSKFCCECGGPKPVGIPQYQCDKCGWEPDDRTHPPKFCPDCGDRFDDGDIVI